MNNVLTLSGRAFHQSKNTHSGGGVTLPNKPEVKVTTADVLQRVRQLQLVQQFWSTNQLIQDCLITAYYVKVAAKTNRIAGYFSEKSSDPSELIRGAKYYDDPPKHAITYLVPHELLKKTIADAQTAATILQNQYGGELTAKTFNNTANFKSKRFSNLGLTMTAFRRYIHDTWYVDHFEEPKITSAAPQDNSIVTLYDTGRSANEVLGALGITPLRSLSEHTVQLDPDSMKQLLAKASYLVAMSVTDMNKLAPGDLGTESPTQAYEIPNPTTEPVIGVIDTVASQDTYFRDWVTYEQSVPVEQLEPEDYNHGTAVDSIIIDGPTLNPRLDDGCGRFRVHHFGVSTSRAYSSVEIISRIKQAVVDHPDIHVWNLSLGAASPIDRDFISAEAEVLDRLQYENNIIFVVSATNLQPKDLPGKRIGAPADSINSMVVASVDAAKRPEPYSRVGIPLSFFTKPDVSYYGGGPDQRLTAMGPKGLCGVAGTSFAAPWIARKLAYLIDVIGLSREAAKALLIDAAIGWHPENDKDKLKLSGNGVVPVDIATILHSDNDEIRYILQGDSELWNTYEYNLKVPLDAGKQPYIAKATLVYFPQCERNQGVDYTDTELDLYFGRVIDEKKIKTINENTQSAISGPYPNEADARSLFRKWDNVKHISEELRPNRKPKKVYGNNPAWGISLKTKERFNNKQGSPLRFSVVITLKEINGINRIDDFIRLNSLAGWIVTPIDVQQRLHIYQESQQEIDLE